MGTGSDRNSHRADTQDMPQPSTTHLGQSLLNAATRNLLQLQQKTQLQHLSRLLPTCLFLQAAILQQMLPENEVRWRSTQGSSSSDGSQDTGDRGQPVPQCTGSTQGAQVPTLSSTEPGLHAAALGPLCAEVARHWGDLPWCV